MSYKSFFLLLLGSLLIVSWTTSSWAEEPDFFSVINQIQTLPYELQSKALHHLMPPIKDHVTRCMFASAEPIRFSGHSYWVTSLAFSPDGKTIASTSVDRNLRIWDLNTRESTALEHSIEWINSVAFSPDGKTIASGSSTDMNAICLWNLSTKLATHIVGHQSRVCCVAFSPNGKLLASGSGDEAIRIWNLDTKESTVLRGHTNLISSIAFSPDGKKIISGSYDKTVRIWDVDTGKSTIAYSHSRSVYSVAFSPDGKKIASGSLDRTIRIFDLTTKQFDSLMGHTNSVYSVAFSPDGTFLSSASGDGTIRIWSLATKQFTILRSDVDEAQSIAFSPDGTTLAVGSSDTNVYSYQMNQQALNEIFKPYNTHDPQEVPRRLFLLYVLYESYQTQVNRVPHGIVKPIHLTKLEKDLWETYKTNYPGKEIPYLLQLRQTFENLSSTSKMWIQQCLLDPKKLTHN